MEVSSNTLTGNAGPARPVAGEKYCSFARFRSIGAHGGHPSRITGGGRKTSGDSPISVTVRDQIAKHPTGSDLAAVEIGRVKSRKGSLSDVATVAALGLFSFVLFILLLPNLDESRTEARVAQASIDVRRILESLNDVPADSVLAERDPWGNSYQVESLTEGGFRVVSYGPDGVADGHAPVSDDISSDMTVSPAQRTLWRKQAQSLTALVVSVGTWLTGSILSLIYRRRGSSSRQPETGQ